VQPVKSDLHLCVCVLTRVASGAATKRVWINYTAVLPAERHALWASCFQVGLGLSQCSWLQRSKVCVVVSCWKPLHLLHIYYRPGRIEIFCSKRSLQSRIGEESKDGRSGSSENGVQSTASGYFWTKDLNL